MISKVSYFSLSWTSVALTLLICILLTRLLKSIQSNKLPPGPFALPILGNLLQIGKDTHLAIYDMSKKYGEIYHLYLGQQLTIVISGKKLSSEILSSRSAEFSMRPKMPFTTKSCNGRSFSLSPMTVADHKRRKTLSVLAIKKTEKNFSFSSCQNATGIQKTSTTENNSSTTAASDLETLFGQEAVTMGRKLVHLGTEYHCKYEEKLDGDVKYKKQVMNVTRLYSIITMCAVVLGRRYKEDDEELDFIVGIFEEVANQRVAMNLYAAFPFLQKIWKKPMNTFIGTSKALLGVSNMHVAARKKKEKRSKSAESNDSDHYTNTFSCVIDHLLELQSHENDESWDDEMTSEMIYDIFGAGVDTGQTFPLWFFSYCTVFTGEMKKAQDELDRFVDKNRRMPKYIERFDLPYFHAFTTEIIRHSSFLPFAVPHTPVEDTTLKGYDIPHGASVLVSFMSLNWDSGTWKSPDVFRPERFIRDDGSFDKDLAEKVNVHGAGRRLCAGITTSRIQIFASTASLLHTFEFECLDKKSCMLPKATMFISLVPNVCNFKLIERPETQLF